MMPADRIEQNLSQLLAELAAPRLPDYRDDLMRRTADTRQRRAWPVPAARPRLAAVLAAVLVVAIGGVLLTQRNDQGVTTSPSPGTPTVAPTATPSTSPSPAASLPGTALPTSLVHAWVGAPRTVPGLTPQIFNSFRFDLKASQMAFQSDDRTSLEIGSHATIATNGELQLVTEADGFGCKAGDVGRYRWALSSGGSTLTISGGSDACRTRDLALPGEWYRIGCKRADNECLGDLDAGTFPSQGLLPLRTTSSQDLRPSYRWGLLRYTVPDGWANSLDTDNVFRLTPSSAYATEGPEGPAVGAHEEVTLHPLPRASGQNAACTNDFARAGTVQPTVDGLIGYVNGLPSVVSTGPQVITIGGHTGKWIDVRLSSNWTTTCPDSGRAPAAVLLGLGAAVPFDPSGRQLYQVRLVGSERQRLIFLDVAGSVVLIVVESSDPVRFDELVANAMPVIDSFSFDTSSPTGTPAPDGV